MIIGVKHFHQDRFSKKEDIVFTNFLADINQHTLKSRGTCSFSRKTLHIPLFNKFMLMRGLPMVMAIIFKHISNYLNQFGKFWKII